MKRSWQVLLAGVSVGVLGVALISSIATGSTAGDIVNCPSESFVPAGSTCRYVEDGDYWQVVERADAAPACDRIAEIPADAVASSCQVERTGGEIGDSALVSYQASDGSLIRVWVLPSGDTIDIDGDGK